MIRLYDRCVHDAAELTYSDELAASAYVSVNPGIVRVFSLKYHSCFRFTPVWFNMEYTMYYR